MSALARAASTSIGLLGTGLIIGRKSSRRPLVEGVELLHSVQDVYLDLGITIA